MKSVVYTQFGEPETVLSLGELALPEPGPRQVRIKTVLAAIHNHDLWTVRGSYGHKPALPAVGGTEAVGVVDAVGEGVDAGLIGRRVNSASGTGTWGEYFLAPAAGLVPLPDAVSDEAAAQLIAMPLSALSLLDFLGVKTGDWIVQNTANGAVGKTLAMLTAARGVHTINLVRRDAGMTEMNDLGIGNVVSTAQPGWKDQVRALHGDAPIRAAVDSIGGDASGDLADLLGSDGLLVSFGTMSGGPMHIPSGDVIFKHLTVKGFWGSRIIADMPAEERTRLIRELVGLVAGGQLQLPVEGTYAFADIRQAVQASLTPGKSGKVLLRP
ncbi:zinc-binding dehydrogenase [Deinococcus sp. Leaf326]|uniref:zinc-binding dehydrogenase n=1 Tax=Deinococcus sp. Leaf326 TaxID=1736338 RepID=UPI0006F8D1C8|nr:zinc-binding dehydrogenase [Deinococcus sp. Leaf326]KQR35662.1 alcohol dehydrogenase [Deinococcus sp. Leaf326]